MHACTRRHSQRQHGAFAKAFALQAGGGVRLPYLVTLLRIARDSIAEQTVLPQSEAKLPELVRVTSESTVPRRFKVGGLREMPALPLGCSAQCCPLIEEKCSKENRGSPRAVGPPERFDAGHPQPERCAAECAAAPEAATGPDGPA
jgi:hypothetical protein